jgi:dTDP-4-amino-4,6-dideoxygalactose transaminase
VTPLIPFNRPFMTGAELDHVVEAVANGYISGNGAFSERCARLLESLSGSPRVLLTHSCTGALEMAAVLSEIKAGDEVVMPSFTFVSTANAVVLRGATPVFVDIREDTLNLDERLLGDAITPRTRAIVAVHYAGVAAEMDAIVSLAKEQGLVVVEDAAQAIGATYRGRPLGSFGQFGALSFHETKNVQCGEGGALLVNDKRFVERAEIIQEKGTNRRAFFRGQVDKYTWVDIGSSYLLSDVSAAFLWAQLERLDWITQRRLDIWRTYHEALEALEKEGRLRRPVVPAECGHNGHLYYVLLPTPEQRDAVLHAMNRRGVQAVFHYIPLHSSPAGRTYGRASDANRVATSVSGRLLRLPLWTSMAEGEVEQVIDALVGALDESDQLVAP